MKLLSMNTVVKIDGIRVRPGDIIVGDGSGIVCVPIEVAEEVMKTATRFDQPDKQDGFVKSPSAALHCI
ncbi:MAG: RraA family protein, partial [Deltaproteobacteria bacterium]|nr:RraA family protein [Deltaproteobacteria bacterium]